MGALLALALIAGCGGSGGSELGSQVGPSPIVLNDTSPAQLSITVNLNMGGPDVASRAKTLLDIGFQHGGRPVQFVAGESVTCNGSQLKAFGGGWFESEFATNRIAGQALGCTYGWHGHSTPFALDVPPALVVTAPADNERVNHNGRLVVRYTGATNSDVWLVGLSPTSKAQSLPTEITATSAVIDTRSLGTGDGLLSLTDGNTIALANVSGSAFTSVGGWVRRQTVVPVVWI